TTRSANEVAATPENIQRNPHSPNLATRRDRTGCAARPMWLPTNAIASRATADNAMGPSSQRVRRTRDVSSGTAFWRLSGGVALAGGDRAVPGWGGEEDAARRARSRGNKGRLLATDPLPAGALQGAHRLVDGRDALPQVPAKPPLHDLLHDAPEVGGRLVV